MDHVHHQHHHNDNNNSSSSLFLLPTTPSSLAVVTQTDAGSFTTDSSLTQDMNQQHHHHHSGAAAAVDDTTATGEADVSGGGTHNMHDMMDDMMKMFFHTTPEDNVLIYGWSTGPTWAAVLSCLLFAALAIVYEALKFVRDRLDQQQYNTVLVRVKSSPTSYTVNRNSVETPSAATNIIAATPPPAAALTFGAAMGSWIHWLQAVLHMVQVSLGYILMLVFMYFNIWLSLSIVLGSGVGYLLFGWARKLNSRVASDDVGHCC